MKCQSAFELKVGSRGWKKPMSATLSRQPSFDQK
jgi:hypothetical protein